MAGIARRGVTPTSRALLAGAIDYAGLFPPASLSMTDAVRNYAAYRAGADAWALGRFVVPIARLAEFRDAAVSVRHGAGSPTLANEAPWQLSALAGAAGAGEWANARAVRLDGAAISAVELRVAGPGDVRSAIDRLPPQLDLFFEVPVEPDPGPVIDAIASVGAKAKVRTGGVTVDAFPSASQLARFIVACADAAVPFKATAGLHHPLRSRYRLTYAPDSPLGEMFGFLNVMVAAALARQGLDECVVAEVLAERDASAIRFDAGGVEWRGARASTEEILRTRTELAVGFGSCSFREPIEELQALGLL